MQDFKKSALHMAVDHRDVAMVRCLISLGANVDLVQPVRVGIPGGLGTSLDV
jgi:ankyrin repeat protein